MDIIETVKSILSYVLALIIGILSYHLGSRPKLFKVQNHSHYKWRLTMKRTKKHVLETESRRALENLLPPEWIFRTKRPDYGIDIEIEIVEDEELTNKVLWVQLKATEDVRKGKISYKIKTSHLKYYEGCRLPVLILLWTKSENEFYYLFTQKYIREKLSVKNPSWRKQKTVVIKFDSKLSTTKDLQSIATDGYPAIVTKNMEDYSFLRFGRKLQMYWRNTIPSHIIYLLFEPSDIIPRKNSSYKTPLRTTVAEAESKFRHYRISEEGVFQLASINTGFSTNKIRDYLQLLFEYGPNSEKHAKKFGFSRDKDDKENFFAMRGHIVECDENLYENIHSWTTDPTIVHRIPTEIIELLIIRFILNNFEGSISITFEFGDKELTGEEYGKILDEGKQKIQKIIETIDNPTRLIPINEITNKLEGYYGRERNLTKEVVIPLMDKMGFEKIDDRHGVKEKGLDLIVCMTNLFGVREYYGIQVKAVNIHLTASKRDGGNAIEVLRQIITAFKRKHIDIREGTKYRVDHVIIITCGKITAEAKEHIYEEMKKRRKIMFIDNIHLAKLIKEHGVPLK